MHLALFCEGKAEGTLTRGALSAGGGVWIWSLKFHFSHPGGISKWIASQLMCKITFLGLLRDL